MCATLVVAEGRGQRGIARVFASFWSRRSLRSRRTSPPRPARPKSPSQPQLRSPRSSSCIDDVVVVPALSCPLPVVVWAIAGEPHNAAIAAITAAVRTLLIQVFKSQFLW